MRPVIIAVAIRAPFPASCEPIGTLVNLSARSAP